MNEKDYFFYEWLIIGKAITEEKFNSLTEEEFEKLKAEYIEFCENLKS